MARAHDLPDQSPEVLENKARIDQFLRQQGIERLLVKGGPSVSWVMKLLLQSIERQPKSLERLTIALAEMATELASLERYERRAVSRHSLKTVVNS
jgi:hypothetical protein